MILSAMKNCSFNANVQCYGCEALWNLAVDHNITVAITKEGGIATILSAMKNHSSDAGVLENCLKALQNLFVNDYIMVAIEIAKAGGIITILSAIIHPVVMMILGIVAMMLLLLFKITHGLYLQEKWP